MLKKSSHQMFSAAGLTNTGLFWGRGTVPIKASKFLSSVYVWKLIFSDVITKSFKRHRLIDSPIDHGPLYKVKYLTLDTILNVSRNYCNSGMEMKYELDEFSSISESPDTENRVSVTAE